MRRASLKEYSKSAIDRFPQWRGPFSHVSCLHYAYLLCTIIRIASFLFFFFPLCLFKICLRENHLLIRVISTFLTHFQAGLLCTGSAQVNQRICLFWPRHIRLHCFLNVENRMRGVTSVQQLTLIHTYSAFQEIHYRSKCFLKPMDFFVFFCTLIAALSERRE